MAHTQTSRHPIDSHSIRGYVVQSLEGISLNDPLTRAMADLAKKEAALKELQAEIDRLRSFIEVYRGYASFPAGDEGRKTKKDILVDAALSLIKERGPMTLAALYEAIETQGIEVGTQNPKQYLSTTFNRDDRLKFVEGKGWTLNRHAQ